MSEMEEVKHTPLPWVSVYAGSGDFEIWGGGNEIATVSGPDSCFMGGATSEANAEFIVAACNAYYDLLKEIERLKAERDAAFAMSKCECGADEACRNLVASEARVKELEAAAYEASLREEALNISGIGDEKRAQAAEQRLAEAVRVLEPFAREADAWMEYVDDEAIIEDFPKYCGENIRVGQLRAARAFIERSKS